MMDKRLFLIVFNNKILYNNIFKYVSLISSLKGKKQFKWSEVIRNPQSLAAHNYFEQLKQCLSIKYKIDSDCKRQTLKMAIKFGTIEMLVYLLDRFKVDLHSYSSSEAVEFYDFDDDNDPERIEYHEPCDHLNSIYSCAAQYGRMDIIEYLTTRFKTYKWNYDKAMMKSPLSRDIDILMYFVVLHKNINVLWNTTKSFISFGRVVYENAALVGRIDMIEYLIKQLPPKDKVKLSLLENAIKGGHFDLVEYLLREHRNPSRENEEELLDLAARLNRQDIIKLLISNGITSCTTALMNYTAWHGNLELLKWLGQNTTAVCSTRAMDNAASENHFECLQWLHFNRSEGCSNQAMDYAACKGHFEIVLWLYNNRKEGCSDQAISDVILHCGRLDIIDWLYQNQPNSYSNTQLLFQIAADLGNLDIIKYLYTKEKHCGIDALYSAAIKGHLNVFQCLFENDSSIGKSRGDSFKDILEAAASEGHLEIVKYIIQNCSNEMLMLDIAIFKAIKFNHLEVVKYLCENITPNTLSKRNYIEIAASYENIQVLQWLHSNIANCGKITATSFNGAIKNVNLPLAKWILFNIGEDQCNFIKKNLFKMDTFASDLFKFNQYEIIEWILDTFQDISKSELEAYKQILETKYPNSVESIEIINKFIKLK
ncbi:hypothetical protein PPL_11970 [Heterostelium album PN500]|uniref:Ankyrin repeat protein n=1 Tax=Heterostelium pallidum (strain ATCC 26659 / Pp 5 / PN500) TaxID=670386 RepID=D3BUZ8_HETP5|nr:hypothetical protein PPL_11970 [Heterostelium album PN500]EFA74936.1 hypothetical protein PPL_11970 [Heterostelium album PN500]|eukprot:XP_020427070.1 hypothetical protein PPL_11970 [Heterostelium album PN500]